MDELELLKKDYQFFSNAMNIVSTGFEDIADNIAYQTLRAFNSQLDSSIETLNFFEILYNVSLASTS